jgi:hypothetical protein
MVQQLILYIHHNILPVNTICCQSVNLLFVVKLWLSCEFRFRLMPGNLLKGTLRALTRQPSADTRVDIETWSFLTNYKVKAKKKCRIVTRGELKGSHLLNTYYRLYLEVYEIFCPQYTPWLSTYCRKLKFTFSKICKSLSNIQIL